MTTISTKYSMYINFRDKFIVIIVSSITSYNNFRCIGSKFWSVDTRKCANLDDHFSQ